MGIRQDSEGGGKVFTRERHGYGFVGGGAVFVLFSGRCSCQYLILHVCMSKIAKYGINVPMYKIPVKLV